VKPSAESRIRLTGLLSGALVIFFIDTASSTALHTLWLPLSLAVCAYLLTQSHFAVAFACLILASLNIDLDAENWVPVWGYSGVAIVSFAACLLDIGQRFRERIAATHEDRWASRRINTDIAPEQENHLASNQGTGKLPETLPPTHTGPK